MNTAWTIRESCHVFFFSSFTSNKKTHKFLSLSSFFVFSFLLFVVLFFFSF